jgi:hypothetical protein
MLALTLTAVGCGSDNGGPSSHTSNASLAATLMGGVAPISNASVTLYSAGTTGRGIAQVLATAKTNHQGKCVLRYKPLASPAVLYIVALGGNAGSGSNSAIALAGIAGVSDALPSSVIVNELTTVAAEFALAQFTDSSGQLIGAASTNSVGIHNAVNLAQANLVDIATGSPAGFWPASAQCSDVTPPDNCDGLERVNSLANILAGCIESSGPATTACSSLFADTDNAADTLEAIHAIVINPSSNAGDLFALSQNTQTYQPVLTAAPDAWTVALNYIGNGAEFDGPGNMAVDAFGNLWISNNYVFNNDPLQSTCGGKQLLELTPIGADAPGAPFEGGGLDGAGFGIAIDGAANVWVANFGFSGTGCSTPPAGNSVSEFNSAGVPLSDGFTQGPISSPQGTAVDQAGNIWITNSGSDSMTKYPAGDPNSAVNFTNIGLSSPFDVAVDGADHIWVTSVENNAVVELATDGSVIGGYSGAGLDRPWGVAADSLGNVWIANNGGDSIAELDSTGTPATGSPFNGGGLDIPWGIAVDGNDNVWVANFTGSGENLSEFCGAQPAHCPNGLTTGDPISPPTGYSSTLLMRTTGVVIDASGNVWVANNWRPIPPPTNPGGDSLVEFIGLAGPVKTPMLGPPQQP